MRILLSNKRTILDATTVWMEAGPDVDIVMDPRNLTFRPGSVDAIYAVHVLDHVFPQEMIGAVRNWYQCLKPGGELHVVVDDFETIARLFVSGDLSVDTINEKHSHPTTCTRDNVLHAMVAGGFKDENSLTLWFKDVPLFPEKLPTELIVSGKK